MAIEVELLGNIGPIDGSDQLVRRCQRRATTMLSISWNFNWTRERERENCRAKNKFSKKRKLSLFADCKRLSNSRVLSHSFLRNASHTQPNCRLSRCAALIWPRLWVSEWLAVNHSGLSLSLVISMWVFPPCLRGDVIAVCRYGRDISVCIRPH